eukprot:3625813-Heterocapsa_arctica.AAC.1
MTAEWPKRPIGVEFPLSLLGISIHSRSSMAYWFRSWKRDLPSKPPKMYRLASKTTQEWSVRTLGRVGVSMRVQCARGMLNSKRSLK